MAFEIGQESDEKASVVFFPNGGKGLFVMAFRSLDATNRLLVTTSANGDHNSWSRETDTGQTTSTSPALAVVGNRLVLAFVSNDASDRILFGVLENFQLRDVREKGETGQGVFDNIQLQNVRDTSETGQRVTAISRDDNSFFIYFQSNDTTGRILGSLISI
jgi:hypothetical protein